MRRMWMLLFVFTLMVVVLAVPARAVETNYTGCECAMANGGSHVSGCPENQVQWQAWSSTTTLPTTSGNYYLTGDVTLTGIQKISTANQYICLDLNGHTVQNAQNSKYMRIYQFTATGSTLVITDSVGGGKIKNTSNYDQGGIIFFQSPGIVKLYAGELDGSSYTSKGTNATGGCLIPVTSTSKFYMYGGTIRGCTLTEEELATHTSVNNGTTYTGHYPYVGPVFVNGTNAVFEMHGGQIYGGYVKGGNTGSADVSGSGGAVCVEKGTMTMYGGTIYGGTVLNSTNASGAELPGRGGALYIKGTLNLHGGTVTGGTDGSEGNASGNLYVTGILNLSGGNISGGVCVDSHSGQAALNLSGTPVVSGTGILLNHNENGSGGYYPIHVTLNLESLNNDTASVVLRYTKFAGDYANGLLLASATANWANHPYEDVARKVLCDYAGSNACEISYEADGIHIRKSTQNHMKWTCACGANKDEDHVNGCSGFDVKWNEWNIYQKGMSMPSEPGYWYITKANLNENAANVKYVRGVVQATFSADYYLDENGVYHQVFAVRAKDTSGAYMTNDNGKNVSVAEYLAINGGVPSYAATVGNLGTQADDVAYIANENGTLVAYTAGQFGHEVLSQYSIYVDLNGLKLEISEAARAISFRGINTKTVGGVTYNTCRTGDVILNMIDSSEDHTGAIATFGVYTGVTADGKQTQFSSSANHSQGKLIWMDSSYNSGDTLNTSYVTLDASSTITGSGLVLYNDGGSAAFWNSTIIGGTSQGFFKRANNTIGLSNMHQGGGAVMITGGGSAALYGGSISGGKAIYRYMRAENGKYYDQAVGGGNVFVDNGTFLVDGGTITGGMALVYGGGDTVDYNTYGNITAVNDTPEYSYGSGGGVYVAKGKIILKNGATITGNYSGTIQGQLYASGEVSANIYNCVNPANAVINQISDNVFLGGNPMELVDLTGTVGYNMNEYVGTFATYTGTAPTAQTLVCDEAGNVAVVSGGKAYYPAKDSSGNALTGENVYLVGYGKASVQPSLSDLQAGMIMDNYGNNRNTATLYNGSYYDIVQDSEGYFGGWDTLCYVTALATTDGEGDTVIILSLDGRSFGDDVSDRIKRMVSNATGVPMNNISISSSHQHSIPGPTRTYSGKTADGDAIVTVNYWETYYNGIVDAAVAAMADRAQATVKVGTLQTTAGGRQYNFVRNVKVMNGSTFMGMVTDNHNDLFKNGNTWTMAGTLRDYTNLTVEYESQADTTLQLVQYVRQGADTIVMANFQTHPHLGSNRNSCYVHSDVVGAFRHYLETLSGSKVIYFSGASGNINTTTYKSEDTNKYPWYGQTMQTSGDLLLPLEKAAVWGESLATMTNSFLNGTTYQNSVAMTAVSGSTDVEVKVDVLDCTLKLSDASMTAITNSIAIRDWGTGASKGTFIFTDYATWETYAGRYQNKEDRIYSSFDASNIRRSLLWAEAGQTSFEMPVTAYAMGEIGFVAAPYEMFHENGSDIKNESEFAMTVIATLANGNNSYIPSEAAFQNDGYSTDQTRFQSGTGENLADKYVEMLNGLK